VTNLNRKNLKSGFWVIAGRPNAGKSTLLNQIIGERLSIVSPKAQTTRDNIRGILTDLKKGQIIFLDTPGMHKAKEGGLNACLVRNIEEAFDGASGVWYLVDPDAEFEHEKIVLDTLVSAKLPVFVVFNKCDIQAFDRKKEHREALMNQILHYLKSNSIRVLGVRTISGKKGYGVQSLLEETWEYLPEGPFYYPDPKQLSDRPMRYFVGELIREQLFNYLGDELPYSCAVEVEKFLENEKPIRIEAVIHVERESQKGMVVGAHGKKIKQIGIEARIQIEKLLGEKVFLGLKVKLNKDWTRSPDALKKLGYFLPNKQERNRVN
jgi:GTP-binding protein Era